MDSHWLPATYLQSPPSLHGFGVPCPARWPPTLQNCSSSLCVYLEGLKLNAVYEWMWASPLISLPSLSRRNETHMLLRLLIFPNVSGTIVPALCATCKVETHAGKSPSKAHTIIPPVTFLPSSDCKLYVSFLLLFIFFLFCFLFHFFFFLNYSECRLFWWTQGHIGLKFYHFHVSGQQVWGSIGSRSINQAPVSRQIKIMLLLFQSIDHFYEQHLMHKVSQCVCVWVCIVCVSCVHPFLVYQQSICNRVNSSKYITGF